MNPSHPHTYVCIFHRHYIYLDLFKRSVCIADVEIITWYILNCHLINSIYMTESWGTLGLTARVEETSMESTE